MQNPFESGHIKNYILAYVGVVVIMVLFFVATSLFNDIKKVDKRVFETNSSSFYKPKREIHSEQHSDENNTNTMKFKLLEHGY